MARRPRARSRRRPAAPPGRTRAALPVAALVLALAACSPDADAATGSGADAPPPTAAQRSTVAAGPDCLAPQVLTALGFDAAGYTRSTHADAPDPVAVPPEFTAVSAVLCTTGETLTDAAGRWAAVTASRLEGDVAPLLDALGAPATVRTGTSAAGCPAGERADLWLVDALGAGVRVALPGSSCGALPAAVADGLAALDVVDVEHYPVALVAPGATPGPTAG